MWQMKDLEAGRKAEVPAAENGGEEEEGDYGKTENRHAEGELN